MTGEVLSLLDQRKLELGPAKKSARGRHWRLASDNHNVAWLVLDKDKSSTNTLSEAVLTELNERLGEVEQLKPHALVIRSAKPSGFIAGADISEFKGLSDAKNIADRLQDGHAVLDRLEGFAFPTIAVLHGYALGGGLELALACDHRIGIEGVKVGFPEVRLGLHPGLGGTFRFTELIDPVEAMTLMLTGKTAHTRKAKKLGILDTIVEERHVASAVQDYARGDKDKQEGGLRASALNLGPARTLAAKQMRAKTREKARKEHYPAPYALIDLWEEHGDDREEMRKAEVASFANLLTTNTAQNLVRVFFLRENLRSLGEGKNDIRHVHVIGAGSMGAEIAAWCAIKGNRVTLADLEHDPLAKAIKSAARLCDRKHLSGIEKRDALDRLMPDPHGVGVSKADLVIEAVPEKPDLKTKIYGAIEPLMKPGAILATNTSSLELTKLARGVKRPAHFAGLHFFNPVSALELVEIVSHKKASADTLKRLRAFTREIDRLPAPVASYPGFLVNRALMPYLMEALLLVSEGVDMEVIDRAAEEFGMPMGPIEVADQVGLDICLHVAESLRDSIKKPMPDLPPLLKEKVSKGNLGRKTGKGFYDWKDGKAKKSKSSSHPTPYMTDRLILPMLDACVECLRNGVVETPDIVDGAMIFATGFAPFRGGPMHYAKTRGIDEIVSTMNSFSEKYGKRFTPDQGWKDLG